MGVRIHVRSPLSSRILATPLSCVCPCVLPPYVLPRIIKNSWGTGWGEGGYVRVYMSGDGEGPCKVSRG